MADIDGKNTAENYITNHRITKLRIEIVKEFKYLKFRILWWWLVHMNWEFAEVGIFFRHI